MRGEHEKKKQIRKKQYGSGYRRDVVRLLLCCGVLAKKGWRMFGNPSSIKELVERMELEGIIKKIVIQERPQQIAYVFCDVSEISDLIAEDFSVDWINHYFAVASSLARDAGRGHAVKQTRGRKWKRKKRPDIKAYNIGLVSEIMYGCGINLLQQASDGAATAARFCLRVTILENRKTEIAEGIARKNFAANYWLGVIHARAIGVLLDFENELYCVYYCSYDVMNWTPHNEERFCLYANLCFGGRADAKRRAILFYHPDRLAREIIAGRDRRKVSPENGFDCMHILPYDNKGKALLKMIARGNSYERIMQIIFSDIPKKRHKQYDIQIGDAFYCIFIFQEVNKLSKFMDMARKGGDPERYRVVCFEFQEDILMGFADGCFTICTVTFSEIQKLWDA